ncbi:hypothetical protein ACO2Q8_19995 [Larkinella sp. VNQ87]|uniref:hypothetical protein n=1 Tax=Larkinella sp. VNQ87 TaxID=3400921 RepID=UPI003C128FFA
MKSVLFYLAGLSLIVWLKVSANPAYFLTPDSYYYLQGARNLLAGDGFTILFQGKTMHCAIWPIGYSAAIALSALISPLSLVASSKVVNLLAIGGSFLLLHKRYQNDWLFVMLAFCTPSLIQLYANTWSETLFVFPLIGFCLSLADRQSSCLMLSFWGVFAFLVRYVGGFLVLVLLIDSWQRFRQQKPVQREVIAAITMLLLAGTYFGFNYHQTGTFSGGHGFLPTEPLTQRIWVAIKNLVEETAFLFRDWDLKGLAIHRPNGQIVLGIILLTSAFQVIQLGRIGRVLLNHRKRLAVHLLIDAHSLAFLLTGAVYLTTTVVLYFTDSSLEDLRFRRLAPATLLLTMGLLSNLTQPANRMLYQRLKPLVCSLFLLSIVHALPKMYLINRLFNP